MSATGLQVFDDTIQKTNIWLNEVMDELGPDRQRAYHALRAVLHTLRDRLTMEESAHLSAQLPMLIRGVYYEGYTPHSQPTRQRSSDEFLADVSSRLQMVSPLNPETATRAVFRAIDRHVSAGEVGDVKHMLTEDIRTLWPS